MDNLFSELRNLHELKIKKPFKRTKYLKKQIKLVSELLHEDMVEVKYVKHLVKKLHELEQYKEFNISKNDFVKIIKQKDIERNLEYIFSERINQIRTQLEELYQELLRQEKDNQDTKKEIEIYTICEKEIFEINYAEKNIKEYFSEVKDLTYSKKYIKSGQIISKIIKHTMFRVEVDGIENIPDKGPCILTPYHHHGAFDPLILNAIISRQLFFLTSVDAFVSIPLYDRLLYKLGCLPLKRDDSQFAERLKNAIPKEKVDNYPSSNIKTLKKMLTHLKHGDALVIFPEGDSKIKPTYARPNNEDFLAPHDGFISLAFLAERRLHKKIPIIPIGFAYGKGLFKSVKVNIGSPVYISNHLQNEDKSDIKKHIPIYRDKIFSIIRELSS